MVRKSSNYYGRPIKEAEWNEIVNIWNMRPEEKEKILKNENESIVIAEKIIAKKINLVLFAITAPCLVIVFSVITCFLLNINGLSPVVVFTTIFLFTIGLQQYFQRKNIQSYKKILQVKEIYDVSDFDATLILASLNLGPIQ